jgi:chemotaxis protein MotB
MAGGGGAWKVAYADFVTAMMAFFMVMWLVSQKPETKQAIQDYFNDPFAYSRLSSRTSSRPSSNPNSSNKANPNKRIPGSNHRAPPHNDPEAEERKKASLKIVRDPERTTSGVIIYFEEGSDKLTEEAEKALEELMPSLTGLPQKIDIRGHMAPQSISDGPGEDDLYMLSFSRCRHIQQKLIEEGIEPVRVRISVAGPHEPLNIDPQSDDLMRNARVEVFLISETAESLQGTSADRAKKLKRN